MCEIEIHPHKPFVPPNAKVLIVGSFPGKDHSASPEVNKKDEWFYASKRNQFWNILRGVYNEELLTTEDKKKLFTDHGIAIADILLKVRRKEKNNQDTNLEIIEYNDKALGKLLKQHSFTAIYFTSRFVEKHFKKLFPFTDNGECLPSPSPRYARMSLQEKINYYREKLPG
jgi:hypoxanthine-DNA glycosylase